MINIIRPKLLVPIHGDLRHLKQHGEVAKQLGIAEENIAVIENGTPLEMDENKLTVCPRMPGGYIFIDGAGVGDIGWSVVRDRERLAQSGIFFAVINANNRGEVIGKPEFISHGFVDLRAAEEVLEGAEETIVRVVKTHAGNRHVLDKKIEDALSRYLYEQTGKRPVVHVILK